MGSFPGLLRTLAPDGVAAVKALLVERNVARFAAARAADALGAGLGRGWSPLRLTELDPPELPGEGWQRVRPLLSGICGSDLATVSARSSRWFEPIVSFPFVPGHEVVGELASGQRVVIEPVLHCVTRGIGDLCPFCQKGQIGNCEHIDTGELPPGLQSGYCKATGGGWSAEMVAHDAQIHLVPQSFTDEDAVMVEPAACGLHSALRAQVSEGSVVVVLGAGTLGLCVVAALRRFSLPGTLIISAKHSHQRDLAVELGADVVTRPSEVERAVRRVTRTFEVGKRLAGGADVVIDCVGSASSLEEALGMVRPRGRVVMAGMPGPLRVDLAPLWQREIELVGAYTYGVEELGTGSKRSFDLAFELVEAAGLGRLVSARYPLQRYEEALAHAADSGHRGAVKVVFEPQAKSPSWRTQ
jgi:threonine dehydrogenase-like Zn-dependent dehydrogenase